jgi:hypothetical protein
VSIARPKKRFTLLPLSHLLVLVPTPLTKKGIMKSSHSTNMMTAGTLVITYFIHSKLLFSSNDILLSSLFHQTVHAVRYDDIYQKNDSRFVFGIGCKKFPFDYIIYSRVCHIHSDANFNVQYSKYTLDPMNL